jgi:hypothetical protein
MPRKYKTVSCHYKKSDATKKKKSMHKAGKTARVVKKEGKYCVLSAGKRKGAKIGAKKRTTRRRKRAA